MKRYDCRARTQAREASPISTSNITRRRSCGCSPMRKKFLVLAAPFDYYRGGSEYQYKILEPHLARRYDVLYCFRHPTPAPESRYVTYDYLVRSRYHEYMFTDAGAIYRKLK